MRAKLLPKYPDIKLEIIVEYGLIDIAAERYLRTFVSTRRMLVPPDDVQVPLEYDRIEAVKCIRIMKGVLFYPLFRARELCFDDLFTFRSSVIESGVTIWCSFCSSESEIVKSLS
jgi:hypothetical protein